jgi:Aminoglycoside-2''-adenylyltransferase
MSEIKESWQPLSVDDVQEIFSPIPIQWWIAGGWALDLYVDRITREHDDIDVVILRSQHLLLQRYLASGWEGYKAFKGKLTPWNKNEKLETHFDNLWFKKKGESCWAFQVMIIDCENDYWIYKRNGTIRRKLTDIDLKTSEEVPYLKPEIQLLYKGGSSVIRDKDILDLENVLPTLDDESREWLIESLTIQYPNGHPWIKRINAYIESLQNRKL